MNGAVLQDDDVLLPPRAPATMRSVSRYTDDSDSKTVPFFVEWATPQQSAIQVTEPQTIVMQQEPEPEPQPEPPRQSAAPPKVSRFSWTNSQAPQTPRELDLRYSVATARSSMPRYRTVESWVQQQTGRVEQEQQLREMLGQKGQEPVPDLPRKYRAPSESTAPEFRVHPGEEVMIPRGSRVPSEILNTKMGQTDRL